MEKVSIAEYYDIHGCWDAMKAARELNKCHGEQAVDIQVPEQDTDRNIRALLISCVTEAVLSEFIDRQAFIAQERIKRGVGVAYSH